ncbi:hypothetical protein ANCDUO_19250 [Ancylostoma duodenale]|uniref:Nudix hydrolase domain-containing protein n=1 Tax=Ancylostoma duodenale TaxID=51022 RepID=A0A0C2C303_9BILA|nr:hypothetical protein ANCDUO_19250 [Ancylostoma duodenale]
MVQRRSSRRYPTIIKFERVEGHSTRMAEEECDRLRALLRLSPEPGVPDGRQDAGVLILLDGTPDEYRVFLCIRSEELRRHPGEVCFPGGMRDNGENMQETAMREAEEVRSFR